MGLNLGRRWQLALLAWFALAPLLVRSSPTPNQTPKPAPELVVGQSAPLSGPSSRTAKDFQEGALAWFDEVNRQGGIRGRRLRLVSLDDRYEPRQTLVNARQLIEKERAIALFGIFGTANTKAIIPLVEQLGVPLVAPRSGARSLRIPLRPMVFNLRASYQAEIDLIINQLVRDGRHQVAVVRIDDAYGEDGLRSTVASLARHGLKPVAVAAVKRNTKDTGSTAQQIDAAHPNAVLIFATFTTSAALTRDLHRLGSRAQLMNLSPVDVEGLQDALPAGQANGIGISQVVPFPWDRRVKVVARYQRLISKLQRTPRFGFTSLEGFLAAQLLTEALERAGPNPNRQTLKNGLESLNKLDLGGFKVTFGPRDHEASNYVDLTFTGAQRWGP